MKNTKIMRVSPLFDEFITKKSIETGIPKVKITEQLIKEGFIDEKILKRKVDEQLWGIFAKRR